MTDQLPTSVRNAFNVDQAGTVIGTITGGQNIFGQVVYTLESLLLIESVLPTTREATTVSPSELTGLHNTLSQTHLVLLCAPERWGLEYVAEALAHSLRMPKNYYADANADGGKLLNLLRDAEKHPERAVIIISGAEAERFRHQRVELTQYARQHNLYLILTTTENRQSWGLGPAETGIFIDLETQNPYTNENLTQWLIRGFGRAEKRLSDLGALPEKAEVTAETVLAGLGVTVYELAAKLGAPGAVVAYLSGLNALERNVQLAALEREVTDPSGRLERWFGQLSAEQRYFVLALCLVEGLRQQTFWAIYEQLTTDAWRERDSRLSMADYSEIRGALEAFVVDEGDRIRFRSRRDRRELIELALKSYRRSLVQALPTLAKILTTDYRPISAQAESVTQQINALEIFGSDLEPLREASQRQNQLRESLALSIAQIGQQEQDTTETVMLAWAVGAGDGINGVNTVKLRLAVSRILVQLWQLRSTSITHESAPWYAPSRAFEILYRWYKRYRYGSSGEASQVEEERRQNIRATIAVALCHLGRAMRTASATSTAETENGSAMLATDPFINLSDAQIGIWFETIPLAPPDPETLRSPWELLMALAWDPDEKVRAGLVFGIPEILESYPALAERLIRLLASDWRESVRLTLARLLVALVGRDPANRYLILSLSNLSTLPARTPITNAAHYLWRESSQADNLAAPAQLWTAAVATLYTSRFQASTLQAYLRTVIDPADPTGDETKAFREALRVVITNDGDDELMRTRVLAPIFFDDVVASANNKTIKFPSKASAIMASVLREWMVRTLNFVPGKDATLGRLTSLLFWRPEQDRPKNVIQPTIEKDERRLLALCQGMAGSFPRLILFLFAQDNSPDKVRTRSMLYQYIYDRFKETYETA